MTEKLGDRWGRGIRYGEQPHEPQIINAAGSTRAEIWRIHMAMSHVIALVEMQSTVPEQVAFKEDMSEVMASLLEEQANEVPIVFVLEEHWRREMLLASLCVSLWESQLRLLG